MLSDTTSIEIVVR